MVKASKRQVGSQVAPSELLLGEVWKEPNRSEPWRVRCEDCVLFAGLCGVGPFVILWVIS